MKFLRYILLLGSVLGWPQFALGQGICQTEELSACSGELDSPKCLELFHACGRYEDIISNFSAEQMKMPANKYYAGMSFYGLFHRSRAKSLQCEFSEQAKALLSEYMSSIGAAGGFRNDEEFRRLYRATRAIEYLKDMKGCLDKGLTSLDLLLLGRSYAEKLIQLIFVRSHVEVAALSTKLSNHRTSIKQALRGLTTKAAEIETQLSMRRLSLEASNRLLIERLLSTYATWFGSVSMTTNSRDYVASVDLDLDSSKAFLQAQEKASILLSDAKKYSKITETLGTVSAEAYHQAKLHLITRAEDELSLTEGSRNLGLSLVEESQGDAPSVGRLAAELEKAKVLDASFEIQKKLRNDWHVIHMTMIPCAEKPSQWFCQDMIGGAGYE